MARPYFTGNYGSALARVDTRPIIEAGRAQGQMYANLGAQVGGMIKEYGLNKQKRAKLTGEVEALYKEHPELLSQIGMSGDEAQDKKDITEREKFIKGDMNLAQLEGYAGKLARGEVLRSKKLQDDTRRILNETNKFSLGLQQKLEGTTIELAENEARHKATITRLMNMKEEDRIALGNLPVEQQILALQSDIDEREAYTGTMRGTHQRESAGLTVEGQEVAIEGNELAQKLNKQQLKSRKQGAEIFEAMGGVPGQVKRLEEDRELQKLQALGLYHARTNIGQSSPATVPIQKILSEAQKELERMGSLTTTLTDDNDKPLSVIDLLEVKSNREIGLKEGYNLTTMSPVTRNNVQLFLTQSGKVQDAQKQMPVPFQGTVDLTNFGSEPPKVGEIIDFNGQEARVVDITGGVVTVNYEGTLYEKNRLDLQAQELEEAARLEEQRNLMPQIRSDFERAGGSARFGQSKL